MPTVQVTFFVGIVSIYLCKAFVEAACLMSIMAMASRGRRIFSLPSCLRGEGGLKMNSRTIMIFCFSPRECFTER
jgi:hypothetical protein